MLEPKELLLNSKCLMFRNFHGLPNKLLAARQIILTHLLGEGVPCLLGALSSTPRWQEIKG